MVWGFGKRGGTGVAGWMCYMALLVLLSACSMQKPGAGLEAVRSDDKSKAAAPEPREQAFLENKGPLKVNYLTPLSEITNPEIFVYKEKRRLYVVQGDVLVREYPVGLGFCPQGDKEKEGDGRTPEGQFFVCLKKAGSRFDKALGLSYPDRTHAEKAFISDTINPFEFRDILTSQEQGSAPPWHTRLGGQVFIHGGGAMADWTNGCVALYNSDIDELFRTVKIGTPVSVLP